MSTISIQDIERDPLGILRRVENGETFTIVRDDHPVAEIKPIAMPAGQPPRQPGSAVGQLVILAEDDEHLRDFQE